MTFHVEFLGVRNDVPTWLCRAGMVAGMGETPEVATLQCLASLPGVEHYWYARPPREDFTPVHVEWRGVDVGWLAEFTDDFWRTSWCGYGWTPNEAVKSLMNDVHMTHGVEEFDFEWNHS